MASNLAATKADLLSRGLIIQTDTIPKGNERRVKAIWDEFEKMKSQLLGYILDVLVKVLKWKKENPGVELVKEYPRLADWAEYCEIVALCIEEKEGAFMEAYNKNLEIQTQEVIEGSDLAIVLRIFIDLNKKFDGSATQLLERLHATAVTNGIDTRNRYWPKTSIRLSHALHILQKTLRDIGIDVSWDRDGTRKNARIIKIRKVTSDTSDTSDEGQSSTKENQVSDESDESDESITESIGSDLLGEPSPRPDAYKLKL